MFSRTLKQITAEANRAEAERRQATGKLTMTSFFLFQDPQSPAEAKMLAASLKYLLTQARGAIEDVHKAKSTEELNARREHLVMYENALKNKMQEYIGVRLSAVPDKIEELLNQSIPGEFDPRADFPRYARECLNATLEICANECVKYLNIFENRWRTLEYPDQASPIMLSIENGKFKDYLSIIAVRVFKILQPYLQGIEISSAVELTTWLNGHVTHRTASGSDDEEENDMDEIPGQAKSHVAEEINNKIAATIFGRIREILLKDVERYMSKSDDSIHPGTSPKPVSDSKIKVEDDVFFEDSINVRLEKALGLGIKGAYPPVKVACRLLVYVNDLTFEYDSGNVSCLLPTKRNT
jgi:hypothetical protein